MTQSRRQQTVSRICSLSGELYGLSGYVPAENSEFVLPVDAYALETYWAQSKLDAHEKKMRAALVKAKAARYEVIAPQYEQMCVDLDSREEEKKKKASDPALLQKNGLFYE